MDIRVWRVTVNGHSALFDRIEDATDFISGGLGAGRIESEAKIAMESEWMTEEQYRAEIEREDAGQ